MRILLVEDEQKIREVLTAYLKNEGWEVEPTADGYDAVQLFRENPHDLVLLDLMIEGLPGEEVCKEIRSMSVVPIIMITSKSRENDTIEGLMLGADDYIVKPFRVKEVIARIHAILRRVSNHAPDKEKSGKTDKPLQGTVTFDKGNIVVNLESGTVIVRGLAVSLTSTELKLLSVLIAKPGKLFSRSDLTYQVLGYRFQGDSRSIDTHLKNLRKKIEEDTKEPRYILTLVGAGYKFAAEPDRRD